MKPKHRRLVVILGGLAVLGIAAGLALTALEDNIVFFRSPTDIADDPPPPGRAMRIGGLVVENSVQRLDGVGVRFQVTDMKHKLDVVYNGILPDLFREGQGVVAEGTLGSDGVFAATEVLAKHDENYMPPEVAEALKKSGEWQRDGAPTGKGGASQ